MEITHTRTLLKPRVLMRGGLVLGIALLLIASAVLGGPDASRRKHPRANYAAYNAGRQDGYQLRRAAAEEQPAAEEPNANDSRAARESEPPKRRFLSGLRGGWFRKDKSADADKPQFDPTAETIRLMFYNASWSHILHKICEQSHSELVMDKVPPGRFSIYKRGKFTRHEVVRILNEQLEPKDFRLVEKGKYVDVVFLRSARARYHRPTLPRYRQERRLTQAEPKQQPSQKYQRGVHNIARARKAAHERYTSFGRGEADRKPALRQAAAVKEEPPAKLVVRVVRPRNHKALKLARAIYKPLKSRAELIDAGPAGLPAFRVFQPNRSASHEDALSRSERRQRQVAFSVGIDTKADELIVEAAPKQATEIIELVRFLDTTVVERNETLKVVPTNTNPTPIAKTLRPQLLLLAQMQKKQPQPKQKQAVIKQPPNLQGLIPIIRGRVTIRDVPGVGLVVIGNEEDVEAVLQIIRLLDKQGELTTPNIHVQPLKHVNSQALAALLAAVYQQLSTIRTGQTQQVATVGFIPVVHPNALLILSSKAGLESVLKLIDELDRPVDPNKEYRVFHLKYQVASQMVANLQTLFQQQAQGTGAAANQAAAAQGLSSRVRLIADIRTNSVVVEAAPNDMKVVANLIYKLDTESIKSVSRIRVFRLKNAVATELAELINNSIQAVLNPAQFTGTGGQAAGAAGQNSQQLREVKSSILEFMVAEGDRKRLVRSGLLTDIRVTADPRINALVVTAPEVSMSLLRQIIEQLDQPSNLVAEIKVFNLANGDATAMVTLLQSLFPAPTGQQQAGQIGFQVAGADDASSGLIPPRFAVNARTNSVIAIGGAGALRVVEAIVFRLDESDIRRRQNTVIKLRNSPVTEVSTAINGFLQAQRDLAQIDPNLVTNQQLLEQEIIVVPETVSNSLLVSATPRFFDEIRAIINRLDQSPPQVVIQALIVEVALDNTDEFGVELGFQDDVLFDRGFISGEDITTISQTLQNASGVSTTSQNIISQASTPGFNFNNNPLGRNVTANPSSLGKQSLSNFSLGRVNGDLGFGGLVLSAQSAHVSVLLRALAAKRTVHILSRPQITALDNQLAQIFVGQDVPTISNVSVNQTTGAVTPIPTPTPTGLSLTVTPRIRPDNVIVMETAATKSSLAGQGVPLIVDATTGNVIESPIINRTEAQATLAVPNGQTVVMGGMITKEDDTIVRKVPWLGDAPLLKYLFRYDSTRTRRTELLIFLTPRIVRDDADAEIIKQIEAERLHFIEEDAEAVHGPLYATPPDNTGMPAPISTTRSRSDRSNLPSFDNGSIPTTNVQQTSFTSSVGGVDSGKKPFFRIRREPVSPSSSRTQKTRDSENPRPFVKRKKSRFSFLNPFNGN